MTIFISLDWLICPKFYLLICESRIKDVAILVTTKTGYRPVKFSLFANLGWQSCPGLQGRQITIFTKVFQASPQGIMITHTHIYNTYIQHFYNLLKYN